MNSVSLDRCIDILQSASILIYTAVYIILDRYLISLQFCSNIQAIGGWTGAVSFSETRNNSS